MPGHCLSLLAKAGIPVRLFQPQTAPATGDDRPALMHHKFITIYRHNIDQYVVGTGSYNFTRSAAKKNCENFMLVSNVQAYQAFSEEWLRVWSYAERFSG
jgi:phosphatidylserine/phosphatidylglycerophosphate/cardiolipin synthase-like enzyme